MIEVKRSEDQPGKSILNFRKRYGIPGIQLVMNLRREKIIKEIEIRKAEPYLSSLML
jgi:hypothetical protein